MHIHNYMKGKEHNYIPLASIVPGSISEESFVDCLLVVPLPVPLPLLAVILPRPLPLVVPKIYQLKITRLKDSLKNCSENLFCIISHWFKEKAYKTNTLKMLVFNKLVNDDEKTYK